MSCLDTIFVGAAMLKTEFPVHLLPVELIHNIFDYLSAIDILQAFSNIDPRLDGAISNYDKYHVNLQSCLKIDFDRICSRIQPHQIISLRLSNNDDTPDQFQLFISRFSIGQLRRLRSITLINIENDLLLNFIDSLNVRQLQSISIIPGFYSQKKLPKNALRKFISHQLKRLDVYNACCINIQLTCNLQYLTVHDCNINELQQILTSMPMLQSLAVTTRAGGSWMTMDKVPVQLKRLVLNLDVWVSVAEIKELLVKLASLRHLELQIKGSLSDLCNGERWSAIVKHLITFDFDFKTEDDVSTSPRLLIESFCTPFWLEEKRWFVAYDDHPSHVYTVPRFASTSAYYSVFSSFRAPVHSTLSSDTSLFHDRINNLMLSNSSRELKSSHRFMHVRTLSITSPELLDRLQVIVDLTQVRCLKLTDTIYISDLEQLIPNILPRIDELHLHTLPKGQQRRLNGIEQIRILHVQTVNSPSRLCRQFSCVERLHMGNVKSYQQIHFILKHLNSHLSFASLSWSLNSQAQRSFLLAQNLLQRDQDNFNYTFRCYNRRFSTVHLWINNSTEPSLRPVTKYSWSQWLSNGVTWLARHIRQPGV